MLKDFIPFAKLSRAVRIHFVSLIENLIETDQGKKKFSEEKLALKIYETLDERFLDELEKEYFEEFFDFLATINEIGLYLIKNITNLYKQFCYRFLK